MKNTTKSTTIKPTVKSNFKLKNLAITDEAIRERAYHIYLKTGSSD